MLWRLRGHHVFVLPCLSCRVWLSFVGSDPRADPQSMQPSLAVRGLGHGPAPCLCQRLGPSAAQQVLEGLQVLGLQVEEEGPLVPAAMPKSQPARPCPRTRHHPKGLHVA